LIIIVRRYVRHRIPVSFSMLPREMFRPSILIARAQQSQRRTEIENYRLDDRKVLLRGVGFFCRSGSCTTTSSAVLDAAQATAAGPKNANRHALCGSRLTPCK
jgi:hypothetical protein